MKKKIASTLRTTLAEVAQEAGVSIMTASRALRGASECAPQTRQRVHAAAKQLGYRPNPLVSAYQAQVRRPGKNTGVSLGWLNDFPERGYWSQAPGYCSGVWRGARSRAEQLGFHLEEIGGAMVDHLAGQLYRNERSAPANPQLIQIAGSWVQGQTSIE